MFLLHAYGVLPACMPVHLTYAMSAKKQKRPERVGFPETGVNNLSQGAGNETQVLWKSRLLTTEPFPGPLGLLFCFCLFVLRQELVPISFCQFQTN